MVSSHGFSKAEDIQWWLLIVCIFSWSYASCTGFKWNTKPGLRFWYWALRPWGVRGPHIFRICSLWYVPWRVLSSAENNLLVIPSPPKVWLLDQGFPVEQHPNPMGFFFFFCHSSDLVRLRCSSKLLVENSDGYHLTGPLPFLPVSFLPFLGSSDIAWNLSSGIR